MLSLPISQKPNLQHPTHSPWSCHIQITHYFSVTRHNVATKLGVVYLQLCIVHLRWPPELWPRLTLERVSSRCVYVRPRSVTVPFVDIAVCLDIPKLGGKNKIYIMRNQNIVSGPSYCITLCADNTGHTSATEILEFSNLVANRPKSPARPKSINFFNS